MIHVVILAFDGALASAITGVVDLFSLAGISWNRIQKQAIARQFKVSLASEDGQKVKCINGLNIDVHLAFDQIKQADLFFIPTIGSEIQETLAKNKKLVQFIQKLKQRESDYLIAGNCTGNFFLAEAGMLNQRCATTHWGYKTLFEQRYPEVNLKTNKLISQDGHIYCAGGGLAWFDLVLHLIERLCGFEVAIHTAKSFVLDYRRDNQLSYSLLHISHPHQDSLVKDVQTWLEQHFAENITLEELSIRFNVTTRTLIRRFNAVLGTAPNQYLQAIRIEAAQKRLEETENSIDFVMHQVGYQDASSFRRLFRKKTGLTPLEYRRRFGRRF